MRYKRLGHTDLIVSELGFGAWGIGGNEFGNSYGPTDDARSIRAVHTALDLGCTLIDTADVYGRGRSERLIGRALRDAGTLNDVVIASKVGTNFETDDPCRDFSRAHITAAIDASLRRLGRDYLDLYQLHNPSEDVIRRGDALDAMERLRTAGKIRHHGVSIHTSAEGRRCLDSRKVEVLQLTYNLLSLLDDSLGSLLSSASRRGVGILAREPLANGFLSGRHKASTTYEPGDFRANMTARERKRFVTLARPLQALARDGVTQAQLALRFVLDEPSVTSTLVGIKTPEQAMENFAAVSLPPFEEIAGALI